MEEQNSSISSFKQFLSRILLPLILIISAIGVVFNYYFEKDVIFNKPMIQVYKVDKIIKETYPDEIAIFGSSRAEGGYIPDSLGRNYYNYGLTGTRYDVTLFFLGEECKKKKNTPWVILNLDMDGLLYGLWDIAYYIPNANYGPVKELLGKDDRFYFHVPFIKYFGRYEIYYRNYLKNNKELTKLASDALLENKGAMLEDNVYNKERFDKIAVERTNTPSTFKCDTTLKNKLLGIIADHPDRRFVFVIAPYHSSYFVKYTNPDEAYAFLNMLRSLKNVNVLDFSKMPLPDSMFLNTTHINYKGAKAFNHALRDSLAVIGDKQ